MCQLIEVTLFIWKLSADQLIIFLDRDQCSVPYFLASLGSEHRKTDTHIGHQCYVIMLLLMLLLLLLLLLLMLLFNVLKLYADKVLVFK